MAWNNLGFQFIYKYNTKSITIFLFSVWQKLEEENSEFFRAYYIRLKLKKQINLFNHLLEHQYNLMKYPVPQQVTFAPTPNGIHPMPGNGWVCSAIFQQNKEKVNSFVCFNLALSFQHDPHIDSAVLVVVTQTITCQLWIMMHNCPFSSQLLNGCPMLL